ncbi:MAG: glycosyltransferase family 2 protein [Patescibacteria group bacterium]
MGKPKYSVIIPTLNEEKFLPHLLTSLTTQTKKNFEVIVVDGSSKDQTVPLAKTFAPELPQLKVIVSKIASLPLQRNLGAREARGEWLVFVDADSVLMPYFMERTAQFIKHEKPLVFTTWFQPDSAVVKDAMYTLLGNLFLEAALLFRRTFPPGPLACLRHDIFDSVGGYDELHQYHEDVDLGLRLRKAGIPFSVLRETLYVWSLRRFRREGTLKVMQQYVVSILPVIFLRRTFKTMPGYIMGGQVYGQKRKKVRRSVLKIYERKLKVLVKELFG